MASSCADGTTVRRVSLRCAIDLPQEMMLLRDATHAEGDDHAAGLGEVCTPAAVGKCVPREALLKLPTLKEPRRKLSAPDRPRKGAADTRRQGRTVEGEPVLDGDEQAAFEARIRGRRTDRSWSLSRTR